MIHARPDRPVYHVLLAMACGLLLVLPFVTTFNDFLTAGVINAKVTGPIEALAAPEARMVVTLLNLFGFSAAADGAHLVVFRGGRAAQTLFISWNCIGWQSLILFLISLFAGLRGTYPLESRVQVVLLGLLGTIVVNLVRMTSVALLAAAAGYEPAIIFHDYGGTLLVVAWLFGFWIFAHRWVLPEALDDDAGGEIKQVGEEA